MQLQFQLTADEIMEYQTTYASRLGGSHGRRSFLRRHSLPILIFLAVSGVVAYGYYTNVFLAASTSEARENLDQWARSLIHWFVFLRGVEITYFSVKH